MELVELLNSVKAIQVAGEVQRKDVSSIHYDSRKVKNGSVFVAIKGYNTDGHKFIMEAISKGALAVVLEDNDAVPEDVFVHTLTAKILVEDSRKALAEMSNYFYKTPSRLVKVIGITGTNGKTTTSYYTKNIIERAGNKTGLMGTIVNSIADEVIPSSLTTPESNDIARLLYEMYLKGCSHAIMEVSSHSLFLNRVHKIDFAAAAFTNITSDHLDFHGNYDNYLAAKKMLFDNLSEKAVAAINSDDPGYKKMIKDCKGIIKLFGKNSEADYKISDVKYSLDGTSFKLTNENKTYELSTSLIGEFNAYNATAAFILCEAVGIPVDTIIDGIKNTPQVPGRMEVVGAGSKKAIIDYSHTADSLEKALEAINALKKPEQKVYTVFGCGGNRDATKRPVMGKVASDLSDFAYLTSDNPRFEDPYKILEDVAKGIVKNNYKTIENREEAIKNAIQESEPDAIILIAGKGHEDYQEIKGIKNHFSDKEMAAKYL